MKEYLIWINSLNLLLSIRHNYTDLGLYFALLFPLICSRAPVSCDAGSIIMFLKAAVVAIIACLLALVYFRQDYLYHTISEEPTETNVIKAWKRIIKVPSKRFERLIVG